MIIVLVVSVVASPTFSMCPLTAAFLTILLAGTCQSARILALVPFPARSHWIVMDPLFQELAARGHQVTVFSPFPQKKPVANYTDVDFSKLLPPMISEFSIEMIREKMPNPWAVTAFIHEIHDGTCEKVLKEEAFQNLLKEKDKYDLLFTEIFGSDCHAYFAHKFNIPIISITTSMAMPWAAERFGLPDNPAYIPNYLVNFTPEMNLWERTYNTVILIYAKFLHQYIFSARTQSLVEKNFGEPLPDLQEVVTNHSSLLFLNSYQTLSQSRPFPPNVIEIGGIHIKKHPQPLAEEFQTILDKAKDGVIVMSFGSLVRSASIPKYIIMMFMNAFAKYKQTFIFKFEEPLPEAPPNVIIKKWLPQRDIMEHKNVIAIIAHGGLASTIEAVYFGKPIIGVPFFADQRVNIMSVVRRGAGVQLDLDNLSEDKISAAVSQIINNPKYSENMRSVSAKFRDRPLTPLESAVYWTEYVIRHKGAPHLRPASVHLSWYQYLLIDVVTVLITALAAIIAALYLSIRCTLHKIKGQSQTEISSSKKKN